MAYEQIIFEKRESVGIITLNRPERLNAWTGRMAGELTDAIQACNDDRDVGAIIVTGAGRGFCAGADVKDGFAARLEGRDGGQRQQEERRDRPNIAELARSSKPLVAAVNGVSVGVGLTFILPFDVIIASDRAQFGMFFVKMGLVPELGSTFFLTQRVGWAHASEMCLTGRLYSAEEAGRIGLVNRVVPHERLMEEALATANLLAANPERQLRWIKGLLTQNAAADDFREAMRREHEIFAQCYTTPEHREAVRAFVEKRPANFRALEG